MISQQRGIGLVVALLMAMAGQAPAMAASVIVQYTFPGGGFAATTTAANVTATVVNATGSSADLAAGIALPDSAFLEQLVFSETPAAAVSNNQFFQFTVGSTSGYQLDLSSLAFDAGRGGASNPRGWVLRSSIDGFAADIGTAAIPTVQPTLTHFSIDLSGAAFQDLVAAVTFRIYGYAPAVPGVGSFFDNLTLNGSVNSDILVPIPGALAMFLAALGTVAARARRASR